MTICLQKKITTMVERWSRFPLQRHGYGVDSCPPPGTSFYLITFRPSRAPSPKPLPTSTPTVIWLLHVFNKSRPPKAKAPPPLSLFFDSVTWNPPQKSKPTRASATAKAHCLRMVLKSSGAMIWWRHCSPHGEREGKAALGGVGVCRFSLPFHHGHLRRVASCGRLVRRVCHIKNLIVKSVALVASWLTVAACQIATVPSSPSRVWQALIVLACLMTHLLYSHLVSTRAPYIQDYPRLLRDHYPRGNWGNGTRNVRKSVTPGLLPRYPSHPQPSITVIICRRCTCPYLLVKINFCWIYECTKSLLKSCSGFLLGR